MTSANSFRTDPRPLSAARRGLSALAAGLVLVACLAAAPGAARAQDAQVQTLIDKIDRLQRELVTLQRAVYRGEPPPAPSAAAPVEGDVNPTQAARLELKVSQLEAQIRSLTGQIEDLTFANDRLNQRLDRLVADVDFRLQRLESGAGPLGAAQPGQGQPGLGQPAAGQLGAAGAAAQPTGQSFDTGPRTLGTISEGDLQALQAQQVQPSSPAAEESQVAAAMSGEYQLPGETPREQYDYAFGLLRQANYGEAELALRTFVTKHPQDALAGNAKYWLGETYYVRGDFQQAAVTFAEAYQEYPDNSKAPDNLLKLGMSLAALGNTADACGTLSELGRRYADAPATVLQRSKQEQSKLGCQ